MRGTLELGERPAQAVFDGAIGLALATGVPLRLRGPLTDADLALAVAAVKLGGDGEPAREQLSAEGEIELTLPRPRAGVHLLELPHAGAVARALWTLSWPLALLGKPSELRLRGPNHGEGGVREQRGHRFRARSGAGAGWTGAGRPGGGAAVALSRAARSTGLRDGGEAAASRGPLRRRIGRPRRNAAELSLHDQRGDRLAAAARHHGAPGAAGARRGGRSRGRRGCGGGGAAGMIALLCAAVFDLILSGARVVDGTGSPWFRADVGIRGDSIAAVGDLSREKTKRRVELRDLAIAPGFIDLLGQSELNVLIDPREESKVRQGITTELTGEGISPAPMNAAWIHEQEPWLRKYKLKIDWMDLSGYFRRLQEARPSINEALLVGAGQVRGIVLGFKDLQPDEKQLAAMQKLVDIAMRQGAFGVSSGLIYQPGSFARTSELIALAKVAAKHRGIYASHIRSESKRIGDALDEAFTIAREARVPVEIWHLKVSGRANWGRMKEVVGRIEAARAAGLDVTADMYPWIASANGLDATIPDWAHEGGVDAMVPRIRDPEQRAQ